MKGRKGRKKRGGRAARAPQGQARQLTRNALGVEVRVYANDRGPPERRRHDQLEMIIVVVGDDEAKVAHASDTMKRMLQNGTITNSMASAARKFQRDFDTAALDQLRAATLEWRSPGKGDDSAVLTARDRIDDAITILGGHAAQSARAIWYVIGFGYTVKEWALRERLGYGRAVNENMARGILIAAMECLQGAYNDSY